MFTDKIELIKALIKAKSEFGEIKKNKTNPFFQSKYADLEAVNRAVDPALAANGLVIIQPVVSEGDRLYVETVLLHTSGQHIESRWEVALSIDGKRSQQQTENCWKAILGNDESIGKENIESCWNAVLSKEQSRQQNEGGGVTYVRRYAKVTLLGLTSEDDDDGNATQQDNRQDNRQYNRQDNRQRQPEQNSGALSKDGERDKKKCFAIATKMGWNGNEIADFFRSHCPVVNQDGGEIMFKKTKSRKEFTDENWKLLADYLKKMQDNKKAAKSGGDDDMENVIIAMGEDAINVTRWLEVNYIADFDALDVEKEKAINALLAKILTNSTILHKSIDDVEHVTKWYTDLGADAADEMVHALARQSQEVVNLFLEHMSEKAVRYIDKMKFASWKDVLKKSKVESGEPAEGEFL